MPALDPRPAVTTTGVLPQVEEFLYREAWLLDQQRLDEWLSLFTDDAVYWVPLRAGQDDPFTTCSLIYDDRRLLEIRVRQTRHSRAHARVPAPRTVHQVTNVRIAADDGDTVTVTSTLVMIEYRKERQRLWGGLVAHRLRRTDGDFRIAAKRIDLINSESELEGIACLF